MASTKPSPNSAWESEKKVFDKARQYLRPGAWFRFVTYLYAERKLLVFFFLHFMATMITWSECSASCFGLGMYCS